MKNGPPANAVTIPTGISDGESSVRAKVSAMTKKIPPMHADAGKSSR
jgi:hypothetical protein